MRNKIADVIATAIFDERRDGVNDISPYVDTILALEVEDETISPCTWLVDNCCANYHTNRTANFCVKQCEAKEIPDRPATIGDLIGGKE